MALVRSAVKIALAAALALLAARGLGLEPGWFAVVASVMVMQASTGGSVKSALARVAGTAVGAIVGVIFEIGLGDGVISVSVAAALSGVLIQAMGLPEAVRVGTVTAPIVMLAPVPQTLEFGWERTAETVLGAALGVGVALLVWPAPARDSLRRLVAQGLGDLRDLWAGVAAPLRGEDRDEPAVETVRDRLRERLARSRQLLEEMKGEPPVQPGDGSLATMVALERRLFVQISSCETVVQEFADRVDSLRDHLRPPLRALVEAGMETLADLQEAVDQRRAPAPPEALEAAEQGLQHAVAEGRRLKLSAPLSPEEMLKGMGAVHAFLQVSQRIVGQHVAVASWISAAGSPGASERPPA